MNRHRLAVVVENDDLEEPAGPVGTDVEIKVALAYYAEGVAHCVLDVLVGNTMLTGGVRDLDLRRLPCPTLIAQVTLQFPEGSDGFNASRVGLVRRLGWPTQIQPGARQAVVPDGMLCSRTSCNRDRGP
ncbi:MAG: hypothetical protein ACRDTK_04675 [Mycobacterium sp.]